MVIGKQVAPEMLADEEEIEKLGVPVLRQDEPRQRDRSERGEPRRPVQALER